MFLMLDACQNNWVIYNNYNGSIKFVANKVPCEIKNELDTW